uniref:Uncharacterized protein n=1 Tax=Tanacetum cinerariifolium TaxID=118510 RepID=A0A699HPX5_TANCI|nr:hypothetical protein [Tanacetum cinerariifolium]
MLSMMGVGPEPVHHTLFANSASTGEAAPNDAGSSHPAGMDPSLDSFFVVQDMDAEALQQTYVPKWTVINDSAVDDSDMCRSVVDHLAPPLLFSQLRSMDYDQLLIEFNVGATRQTCLSFKVRLRLEHELTGKKKFEGKCAVQTGWLKEKDAEITSLKAQLSLKDAEAAEAIHLQKNVGFKGRVAALESVADSKDVKLASSNSQVAKMTQYLSNFQLSCDELSVNVSSLEFKKDKLVDQVVQDEQVKALSDRVAAIDFDLMEMALYMDEEFYTQSRKDASIADIMDLLRLEGPATKTPKASQLQHLPEQLMIPVHRIEDQVVIKETSLSFSLDVAHTHVQRIRGDVATRRLSFMDAMVPLIEPLSVKSLTGETSTSGVSVMTTTTALSTTFI